MHESVTVVILDPNSIYRAGLLQVIQHAGFSNCLALESPEEVDDILPSVHGELLFLADLGTDQELMAAGVKRLQEAHAKSLVVLTSDKFDDQLLIAAMKLGADGFVMKLIAPEALVKSLEVVILGQHVYPKQILDRLRVNRELTDPEQPHLSRALKSLSAREAAVLKYLSQGKANKIIAREFSISEATVKVHVKAILRKLRAKNRTEAAIWVRSQGAPLYDDEDDLPEPLVLKPALSQYASNQH